MRILFDEQEVQAGVKSLSEALDAEWGWCDDLLLVTVLDGGRQLGRDMKKHLPDAQFASIIASSYHGRTQSTGTVDVSYAGPSFKGRVVVFIDDIYDSGLTMKALCDFAYKADARIVSGAALINKRVPKQKQTMQVHFSFTIPDLFVIGYGMDYENEYRELPYVAVM